ncbi:MAG: PAS domain-containing sensor histidine kinase, partial [Curvibacter sp.]
MFLRLLSLLLIQGLGAVLGIWLAPDHLQIRGVLAGMLAAGTLWVLWDFTRGLRVLQWLRGDDLSEAPLQLGLWGAVAER